MYSGRPFLNLEKRFGAIGARVERPAHRAKEERIRRLPTSGLRVRVAKRGAQRVVLETEPRAPVTKIEMIVERVDPRKTERLLLAMKRPRA